LPSLGWLLSPFNQQQPDSPSPICDALYQQFKVVVCVVSVFSFFVAIKKTKNYIAF